MLKYVLIFLIIFVFQGLGAQKRSARTTINLHRSIKILEKKLKKSPQSLKLRVKLAKKYKQDRVFKKCSETLIPYSNELDNKALFLLAYCLGKSKAYKDEIKAYKKILLSSPSNIRAKMGLAGAYANAEIFEQSVKEYRGVIQLRSQHLPAYIALLRVFDFTKNEYEQLELLKDMMIQFGERPAFSGKACLLYSKQTYFSETIKYCEKAIRSKSNKGEYYIHLAKAYLATKQEVKAKNWYNLGAKRFPKSEVVQTTVGEYYLKLQDYYVAKRYFNKAIQVNDKSSKAHLGFAHCSFNIKKYQQAYDSFLKACKLDSRTANEFKNAAARLRINKETLWYRKYFSKSKSCGLKPLKKIL